MDIIEFRKQYPAYDNLSDGALADALYSKYYTSLDRADFDSQFLVAPQDFQVPEIPNTSGFSGVGVTPKAPQRRFTQQEIDEQGGEFFRAGASAVDSLQAMGIGGVEAIGEATGLYDTAGLTAMREEQERQAAEYAPPRVPSYTQVESGEDLFDYIAGMAGGGLTSTLGILGAGTATTLAAPFVGITGAAATALGGAVAVLGGSLVSTGDVYSTLLDEGVPEEKAALIAPAAGFTMGSMELLPFSTFIKNFAKAPLTNVVKQKVLRRVAVGALTTGAAESGVETLQEGVSITAEIVGTGKVPTGQEVKERSVNAAIGGLLIGGPLGGGGAALGGRRKPIADADPAATEPEISPSEDADLSPEERVAQRVFVDEDPRSEITDGNSVLSLFVDELEKGGRTKLAGMANQLLAVDADNNYIVSNEDATLQLSGIVAISRLNSGPNANDVDPDFENVIGREIRTDTDGRRVAGAYDAERGVVRVDPTIHPLSTIVHETIHHWDTVYSRLDPQAHKQWAASFSPATSFKQGLSAEVQAIIGEETVNKFDADLQKNNVKMTQRELTAYAFQAYEEARQSGTLGPGAQRSVLSRVFKELSNYIGRVIGSFSGNPRMTQADAFNYVQDGKLTKRLQELQKAANKPTKETKGVKKNTGDPDARKRAENTLDGVTAEVKAEVDAEAGRRFAEPDEPTAAQIIIPEGDFAFPKSTFTKRGSSQRARRRGNKTLFFNSDLDYAAYDLREGSTAKEPMKAKHRKLLTAQKLNVKQVEDYGTQVVGPEVERRIEELGGTKNTPEATIRLDDLRVQPETATPTEVESEYTDADQAEYESRQAGYDDSGIFTPTIGDVEAETNQREDDFRLGPEFGTPKPRFDNVTPSFARDYDLVAYMISKKEQVDGDKKFIDALVAAGFKINVVKRHGAEVIRPMVEARAKAAKKAGEASIVIEAPERFSFAGEVFPSNSRFEYSELLDRTPDLTQELEQFEQTGVAPERLTEEVSKAGHNLKGEQVERRVTAQRVMLSPQEKTAIDDGIKKIHAIGKETGKSKLADMPKSGANSLEEAVRQTRARFPTSDGWVPIEFNGIDKKGNLKFRVKKGADEQYNFGTSGYRFNVRPGKKSAPSYPNIDEGLRDRMSESLVQDVVDNRVLAEQGNEDALTIERQTDWYQALRDRLRTDFGGFGDVIADALGATSPNTPVMDNFSNTVEGIRRFVRGDYDKEMQAFIDHLENGGTFGNYDGPVVLKGSGKKFGINSENLMKAFADVWRDIKPGMAPKARNFSGNLIGSTNFATIDVWAARYLRRKRFESFGRRPTRLPTVVEQGVSGEIKQVPMESAAAVSGEFGFGQSVLEKAAQILNERQIRTADGRRFTDADLQALTWFIEKAVWRKNRWTSDSGEGGSFEQQLDKFPTERYVGGIAIERPDIEPSDQAMESAAQKLLGPLRNKDGVFAIRANPSIGRYGGSDERSFDFELTAEPTTTLKPEFKSVKKTDRLPEHFDRKQAFDPNDMLMQINEVARDTNQDDAFFSRVLAPNEASNNPNARPGIEIYFKDRRSLETMKPLLEKIQAAGADGFTMITDYRAGQKPGVTPSDFVGVRMQFVPEISMRFDSESRKAFKQDPVNTMAALENKAYSTFDSVISMLEGQEGIVSSQLMYYDTQVTGRESYSDVLNGKIVPSVKSKFGTVRSQRSVNDHVSERIEYLEGRKGGVEPTAEQRDLLSGNAVEQQVLGGEYSELLAPLSNPKDERLASRITPRLQQNLEEFKVSGFDAEGNVRPLDDVFVPEVDLSLLTRKQSDAVEKISPSRTSRVDTIWGMFRDKGLFNKTKWVANLADPYNALLQSGAINGYMQSRIAHNMSSTIGEFIIGGPSRWTRNGFVPITKDKDGKEVDVEGLPEIFEPIARKYGNEGLHLWGGYVQAVRSRRMLAEGRENNLTASDIIELLNLGKTYPEFETARLKWLKFNDRTLDVAVDSGYLSKEQAEEWKKYGDFVPFYRVDDEAVTNSGERLVKRLGVGSVGRVSEASRRLLGGAGKVNSIIPNMILNTEFLLTKSMRNYAAQRAVEEIGPETGSNLLTEVTAQYTVKRRTTDEAMRTAVAKRLGEDHPLLEDITAVKGMYDIISFEPREGDKDQNVIHVRSVDSEGNHGKKHYEVNDPLLFNAMTYVPANKMGKLMKVLNWQRTAFSQMITKFPDFLIANFLRDTMSARAQTSGGHSQVLGALKGVAESLRSDGVMRELRLNGGTAIGGYHTDSQLRRYQNMTGDMDTNHIMVTPKSVWAAWDKLGEAFENANRVAVYKAAKSQGKTGFEAGFNSRDVLDFSLSGEAQLVKFLITTVPFLNARIQGLYKFARSGSEKFGGKTSNRANFWMYTSLYGLAASALYASNEEDERYRALSDTAKDLYLHIYLDKLPGFSREWLEENGWPMKFTIPKPFEVGLLGMTVPERIMQQIMDENAEGKDFGKAILAGVTGIFKVNPFEVLGPIPKGIAEDAFNFNVFRMKNIVPKYQAQNTVGLLPKIFSPSDRDQEGTAVTDPYASEIMNAAAKNLNIAPQRIQNAMDSWFPKVGRLIMGAGDMYYRADNNLPPIPRRFADTTFGKATVGRFFPSEWPIYSQQEREIREISREISGVKKAIDNQFKYNKVDPKVQSRKIVEQNRIDLYHDKFLKNVAKDLSEMAELRKAIDNSATLTDAEKIKRRNAIDKDRALHSAAALKSYKNAAEKKNK